MTKFEKETRHRLYVFIKNQRLTQQNARQQRAHATCSVHFHWHDVLTVPLTVLGHRPITSMRHMLPYQAEPAVLLVLKSSWWKQICKAIKIDLNPFTPKSSCNSPCYRPYNPYDVCSENLELDQRKITNSYFFFLASLGCLTLYWYLKKKFSLSHSWECKG